MAKTNLLTLFVLLFVTSTVNADYLWYPCQEAGFEYWLFLKKDGKTVGGWDRKEQVYRPRLRNQSRTWGDQSIPPYPVPEPLRDWGGPEENFGLDVDRIGTGYQLNGKPISRERAYALVGNPKLEDDSQRKWLTVVGTPEQQAKAKKALKEIKDFFEDDLIVAGYEPSHWHVDGLFQQGISYQAPDGTMLAFADKLPRAELFAKVLREANPNYDQSKVPTFQDFDSWFRDLSFKWENVPQWVWMLIGGLVLYLLITRRK